MPFLVPNRFDLLYHVMSTEQKVPEVTRKFARYVFLDVVGFSHNRSAQAQAHIVNELNRMVREGLLELRVDPKDRTLLPTGDGICIALHDLQFDLHIQVALNILARLDRYNLSTEDIMRKFEVRIGINQNTDIGFNDINDSPNLAGAGINLASRIMGLANGNQIFVSELVFNELHPSEEYMNKFRAFKAKVKHDIEIAAYQFIGEGYIGLNSDIPTQFKEKPLTKFAAHYISHTIKMKPQILAIYTESKAPGLNASAISVALYFLAQDSISRSEATETRPYKPKSGKLSFEDQVRVYSDLPVVELTLAFCEKLFYDTFSKYADCFETTAGNLYAPIFVTDRGVQRVMTEQQKIYREINPIVVTFGQKK